LAWQSPTVNIACSTHMPASRADSRMRAPGKQSATPAIDKREDKTDLGDRQRSSQLTSHLNPGRDDGPTQERGCHPNGPLWGNIGHARRCRRAAALGRQQPYPASICWSVPVLGSNDRIMYRVECSALGERGIPLQLPQDRVAADWHAQPSYPSASQGFRTHYGRTD
jgi:hypothetical protein